MQVRDGPAAVRGDAPAPRRHWPTGREGGAGGSPESEDLPLASNPNPSRKEDSCQDVSVLFAVLVAALARRPRRPRRRACTCASKARRRRSSARPRRRVDVQANALDALDVGQRSPASSTTTSRQTSFGPYVDQIGRYAGRRTTGWVFKVNGVSPPVGADQVTLQGRRHGALVLGDASARPAGRRRSRSSAAPKRNCYRVCAPGRRGQDRAAARRLHGCTSTAAQRQVDPTGVGLRRRAPRARDARRSTGAVRSNARRGERARSRRRAPRRARLAGCGGDEPARQRDALGDARPRRARAARRRTVPAGPDARCRRSTAWRR